jgi:hypothetical protein
MPRLPTLSKRCGPALLGETEPLKRFGININEAAIQAQALSMGLVKTRRH